MKNLYFSKLNKKLLKLKHWVKKEWFLWGVAKTSILMDLGFKTTVHSWEEFDEHMGWK